MLNLPGWAALQGHVFGVPTQSGRDCSAKRARRVVVTWGHDSPAQPACGQQDCTCPYPINPQTCSPWLSIPHRTNQGFPGTRTHRAVAEGLMATHPCVPVMCPHTPGQLVGFGHITLCLLWAPEPWSALALTFRQGGFLQDLIQEIDQLVCPPARDVHGFDRLHVQGISCPELCQLIRRPHQLLPWRQVRQVGRPARRVQPAVKFKPCSEAGGRAGIPEPHVLLPRPVTAFSYCHQTCPRMVTTTN